MPEDEIWECYPKGRGTECHRRRKLNNVSTHMQNERKVLFGNNREDGDQIKSPQSWEHYDYDLHYGTHDLLADIALSLHKSNFLLKLPSGQDFWTEERRKIYLYATEAPDRPKTQYKGTYMMLTENQNYIRFPAENEILTELGEADDTFMRRFHLLQFDEQKNMKKEMNWFAMPFDTFLKIGCEENAATRSQFWYEKGLNLYQNKEYNAAAFCFGVMAHYIGDVGCFFHVIDPFEDYIDKILNHETPPEFVFGPFILQHGFFENQILKRTDSISQESSYSDENDVRNKFFKIDDKKLSLETERNFLDAKNAAENVARYTSFGKPSSKQMYEYYSQYYEDLLKGTNGKIEDTWPKNHYGEKDADWHYDDKLDPSLLQFLLRTEEILNYTISQIACVLNRVAFELRSKN